MKIVNLTPHPITIIRSDTRVEYPACAPAELPRATEADIGYGGSEMALTNGGSDGQGGYENAATLQSTGLVNFVGYTGVENLPDFAPGERMFGVSTFYIVSIVTAIGALAADRGIEDLLVPMGQVRDANGRIIGATGLAPATSLLTPMYQRIVAPYQERMREAIQRNSARPVSAL